MFVVIVTACFALFALAASAQEYDSEIAALASSFPSAVDDRNAIQALVARAEALDDRIREDWRSGRDSLPQEQLDRLKHLEDEAEALEDVFEVVGQLDYGGDIDLEDFEIANQRLALEWEVLALSKEGIELIRIDIGGFQSFLFRNPTAENYIANYQLKTPDGEQPGGGVNLPCAALVGVLSSREDKTRNIELVDLSIEKNIFLESCS